MNKESKSHLSNLVALALADGKLVENEILLLIEIGKKMGLPEPQVMEYCNSPGEIEFVVPASATDCYSQLFELINMVIVDEEIHENEVVLLKKYAEKLRFSAELVDKVVTKIQEFLHKGYNVNRINSSLNHLITKF